MAVPLPYLFLGNGQIVIRNAWPQMVSDVAVHVVRRKELALQPVAVEMNHAQAGIRLLIRHEHRMLAEYPDQIGSIGKQINRQKPEHEISPPADKIAQSEDQA